MKDFFYSIKASSVFIGTVIGAGFATGEEIRAYFGTSNLFSVLLSALFFGIMCGVFLCAGKVERLKLSPWVKRIANILKILCIAISFLAMTSGAEEIFRSVFGLRGGGAFSVFLCWLAVRRNREWMGVLNLFIVPVIVVFVFVLLLKSDGAEIVGKNTPFSSFLYACMNIFGAGMIMSREGKRMNRGQILVTSLLSFVVVGALMLSIRVIIERGVGSMPLLSVAKGKGVGGLAYIVIYLAIFTTLLSDVAILLPDIVNLCGKSFYALVVLLVASVLSVLVDFSYVVNNFYPVIGFCGVLYLIFVLLSLLRVSRKFFFYKGNHGVHTSG